MPLKGDRLRKGAGAEAMRKQNEMLGAASVPGTLELSYGVARE